MPIPIRVAVHVDRATAIRSGRNRWGWLETELDLDILDANLREALVACPERGGITYLTQVKGAERYTVKGPASEESASAYYALPIREEFAKEQADGTNPSEASSETAFEVLNRLATKPQRRLEEALAIKARLEDFAATEDDDANKTAEAHIEALRTWLRAPAGDLVTEKPSETKYEYRFLTVPPPEKPRLWAPPGDILEVSTHHFEFRDSWHKVHRVILTKGAYEEPQRWHMFALEDNEEKSRLDAMLAGLEFPDAPPIGQDAQRRIEQAWLDLEPDISAHSAAVQKACQDRMLAYEHARLETARTLAEEKQQAAKAALSSSNKEVVLHWTRRHAHQDLVGCILDGKPDEEYMAALRAAVFDPLVEAHPRYRKITKKDLIFANPGFSKDEHALDAQFEDHEAEIAGPAEAATYSRLSQALVTAEVPAQYRVRRHRAVLKRRDTIIGAPVEARSLHVTAFFGTLTVTREFALGPIAPVEA